MIRFWLPLTGLIAVAACAPQVPDSAAGVGFEPYGTYQYNRIARNGQLETPLAVSPETTGAPVATTGGTQAISAAELAAAGIDIAPDTRVKSGGAVIYGPAEGSTGIAGLTGRTAVSPAQAPSRDAVSGEPLSALRPASGAPIPLDVAAAQARNGETGAPVSISDEQDFGAVAARESIQSDAERIAEQRAQYRQVTVDSVPQRPASTGPDIVAYALQSSNAVGQKVWSRSFGSARKAARNCAKFTAPDIAQREFLARGGPQRDRLGLDPDGDGFACGWSPEPFRAARQG